MKKSVWGPQIWILLHCITIKIKEQHFSEQKKNITNMISQICSNVPCPLCASHATGLLRKFNIHHVKTKDQLIRLIFTLHNDVNTKLKKRPFDFVNLLSTYQDHNFKNVLVQYYNTFISVNFGEKMMLYSFRRKLFLKNFHTYFKDNIDLYDL